MSFLLNCPNCGSRSVYEFQHGGEVQSRPAQGAPRESWTAYIYWRKNRAAVQREWWFHRLGCRQWFLAERNTVTNRVTRAFLPEPPANG
jgi:sarcosine oxidase subunit delta